MDSHTQPEKQRHALPMFALEIGMMSMMMRQANLSLDKSQLGAIVPGVDTERSGTNQA
jgi:hypothetical protein